jgi:hypothetical protein
MCAVAARGLFRGMGYVELTEHGVSFCLSDMARLVEFSERVVAEDVALSEASAGAAPMMLKAVPA